MSNQTLTPAAIKALSLKRDRVIVCHAPREDMTDSIVMLSERVPKAMAIALSPFFADVFKHTSPPRPMITVTGGHRNAFLAIFDHLQTICDAGKMVPFADFDRNPFSRSVLVSEAARILGMRALEAEMEQRKDNLLREGIQPGDVKALHETSAFQTQEEVTAHLVDLCLEGKLQPLTDWEQLRAVDSRFRLKFDRCLEEHDGATIESVRNQYESRAEDARKAAEAYEKGLAEERTRKSEENARRAERHKNYLAYLERKQAREARARVTTTDQSATPTSTSRHPIRLSVQQRHGKKWAPASLSNLGIDHGAFVGAGPHSRSMPKSKGWSVSERSKRTHHDGVELKTANGSKQNHDITELDPNDCEGHTGRSET